MKPLLTLAALLPWLVQAQLLIVPAQPMMMDSVPAIELHLPPTPYTPLHKGERILMYAGVVVCGLVAGVADGQRETIVHNIHAYAYRHPNANPLWYNPRLSARRADGSSYLGGSLFVFTKDKLHLNQMIRSSMFATQSLLVVTLSVDEALRLKKLKPGRILLRLATAQASYMLSKHLTHRYYDVF